MFQGVKNLLASLSHAFSRLVLAENSELPPDLPMVIPPYLQNPAPDRMTICFAARQAKAVRIAWNREGETTPVETEAVPTIVPGTPWTIWKIRLAGLRPGTAYRYQLRYRMAGREQLEMPYVFRTPDPAAATLRLAVFNDLHNNDEMLELLMRHVQPEDYEFSVLLGDCWEDPSLVNGAYQTFATLNAYVHWLSASEKPMLLVRGNHETRGDFADRLGLLFDVPGLEATAQFADQDYRFALQAGPVWLLAMDGGDDFQKRLEIFQPYRQRQLAWLEEQLAANPADTSPWRLLLCHMPLYNDNIWNSEPARLMWEPRLATARIDLALSGHDHGWKLLQKDRPLQHHSDEKNAAGKPIRKTWTATPPYPVLIGGGPAPGKGTVMLLQANRQELQARLISVEGRQLAEVNLGKGTTPENVKNKGR
jgi:hypothetical protein